MKLGFTGTRDGMTLKQRMDFMLLLEKELPDELHHGDCVGCDEEAHDLFLDYAKDHAERCKVVVHPPANSSMRAFCGHQDSGVPIITRKPRDYLRRNENIVLACDLLAACPKESTEQQRSGTWSTIRRARKSGKRVVILEPLAAAQPPRSEA